MKKLGFFPLKIGLVVVVVTLDLPFKFVMSFSPSPAGTLRTKINKHHIYQILISTAF